MGVYLMGVYLMGVSHGRASYKCASHGRVPLLPCGVLYPEVPISLRLILVFCEVCLKSETTRGPLARYIGDRACENLKECDHMDIDHLFIDIMLLRLPGCRSRSRSRSSCSWS
jgi:hypothetical protein